jgi:sugar transferase (PEP-CTERM/EpsH1 system associated)
MKKNAPLIVHLLYEFDFGGLEMLLVECINRIPADKYRHAIICLTHYTDFSKKITRPDVEIFALNKQPGLGLGTHVTVFKLLRRLKPAILHTYNIAAIEYTVAAALAGVPVRIHAMHGRDARDPDGRNRKHNLLRRLLIPLIDMFVPVSADLQRWFKEVIHVPDAKNRLINNGVDTLRFAPAAPTDSGAGTATLPNPWNADKDCFVIGTVGRIQDVKDHLGLIDAFMLVLDLVPEQKDRLRLVIVGDGPLLPALREKVEKGGIADLVYLPGSRTDIAEIMQTFSIFALSSIAEGTPVVILEAMASGLPVVATRVGGVPEVVTHNVTGVLAAASDPAAFAAAIVQYIQQPELIGLHGAAGRARVQEKHSVAAMVSGYTMLYDELIR